jgi:uncharacterized membrane protein YphA (DoxX/SURF4 family)
MLGWFGGRSLRGSVYYFTTALHIPAVFACLAIASDFLGGIALIASFPARAAGVDIAIDKLFAS